MLADAIRAEAYKFLRNRGALFWGFCAPPMAFLFFNLALTTYLNMRMRLPESVDIGRQVLQALGLGGSSFFQIFFVAGAASLFASEYRWETWRLQTPRNSRFNLLLAKFTVYGGGVALSLLGLGLGAFLNAIYAAAFGAVPAAPGADFPLAATGVFLATWAELLVLGAFTALVAVASRAVIGALMAGICFSFAQGIAMAIIHPWEAPLRWLGALPSMDAYLLRAWITGQEIALGIAADPARALTAMAILAAWLLLAGGLALACFQRQDLPRE